MDINLPELNDIMKLLNDISSFISNIESNDKLKREWYTDEECWQLKGGGSLKTFRSNRYYQPKGGIPDGKVCGRKVWNKETVKEWLSITDDKLPEYHLKYKTGATLHNK